MLKSERKSLAAVKIPVGPLHSRRSIKLLAHGGGPLQQYIKLRTFFLGDWIVEISKERFLIGTDDRGGRSIAGGLKRGAPQWRSVVLRSRPRDQHSSGAHAQRDKHALQNHGWQQEWRAHGHRVSGCAPGLNRVRSGVLCGFASSSRNVGKPLLRSGQPIRGSTSA